MEINYIMLHYDFDPELCLCARLLERAQFKPWGVKKKSVPYMTEIALTSVLVSTIKTKDCTYQNW